MKLFACYLDSSFCEAMIVVAYKAEDAAEYFASNKHLGSDTRVYVSEICVTEKSEFNVKREYKTSIDDSDYYEYSVSSLHKIRLTDRRIIMKSAYCKACPYGKNNICGMSDRVNIEGFSYGIVPIDNYCPSVNDKIVFKANEAGNDAIERVHKIVRKIMPWSMPLINQNFKDHWGNIYCVLYIVFSGLKKYSGEHPELRYLFNVKPVERIFFNIKRDGRMVHPAIHTPFVKPIDDKVYIDDNDIIQIVKKTFQMLITDTPETTIQAMIDEQNGPA